MTVEELPITEATEEEATRFKRVVPPGGLSGLPIAHFDAETGSLYWLTRRRNRVGGHHSKQWWKISLRQLASVTQTSDQTTSK
jgi:hypothetical protein